MLMKKRKSKIYDPNMGVYAIVNSFNKKMYIGSSCNLYRRIYNHAWGLKENKHHNQHLQNSFNKYGAEVFNVHILEFVHDRFELLAREKYYIDSYATYEPDLGYNKAIITDENSFTYTMSAVSRENMVRSNIHNNGKRSGKYRFLSPLGECIALPNTKVMPYEKKEHLINILLEQYNDYCSAHWEEQSVIDFLDAISYYLVDDIRVRERQKFNILSLEDEELIEIGNPWVPFSCLNYDEQIMLGTEEPVEDSQGEEFGSSDGVIKYHSSLNILDILTYNCSTKKQSIIEEI